MEKNQKIVGVKPSEKVLKKYCAQRSQALRLLRILKTGVNKYTENFERNNVNKKKKDNH